MKPTVSYVIVNRNRKDMLIDALESIRMQKYENKEIVVVDNNSTDGSLSMLEDDFPEVKVILLNTNAGASKGRNIGIDNSKGEIIIFIDSDAVFKDNAATSEVVKRMQLENNLGVMAFKIVNFYTGKIERSSIPRRDKRIIENEYECSYFSTCGVAVKSKVFTAIGKFPDEFFIYGEELDLSYRILEAGLKLLYNPQIIVYHKKFPGVMRDNSWLYYAVRNRIWVALKYLPFRYAFICCNLWLINCLINSIKLRALHLYVKGLFEIVKKFPNIWKERTILSPETIKRIKQLSGRLYY